MSYEAVGIDVEFDTIIQFWDEIAEMIAQCWYMTAQCKKNWRKRNKKHEIESDTNLEMTKVSQELLGFRILNFEPESKICQKFEVFILFCKVTSCGRNAGLFQNVMQCYVIIVVDF